jgi:hypothetical protein
MLAGPCQWNCSDIVLTAPHWRGHDEPISFGLGAVAPSARYALSKPREIAIIGDPGSADTQALLGIIRDGHRPFRVVALGAPNRQGTQVPLLQDRGLVGGQAAAYVCDAPTPGRAFACQAPITEPERLQEQLGPQ